MTARRGTDAVEVGGHRIRLPRTVSASAVQQRIGATAAAAFDVNTACTSFMYGLSVGTSMV